MYEPDVGYIEPLHESTFSLKNALLFVVCIAAPILVGMLSAYLTKNNMVVFDVIEKPVLTPPAMVFPIAWSVLYILMGVASFLAIINCSDSSHTMSVLLPYIAQLALNFFWSIVFFNMQSYGFALAILILMWIMIIRSMIAFATASNVAAMLMVPYVIWVTFAAYLNIMIVIMN